ncbi:glycosyl hydrolase family 28-related protein [Nesterenkonia populi]|uniref:glycosyl hydrolase family 28-related protein n=1 Tax=Nesterenkonia populi TaxID=1591087 RepID=UPI0011BE1C17|nr:glycosyl hydrolase family 28-related protein [Nesterenkonia populi]
MSDVPSRFLTYAKDLVRRMKRPTARSLWREYRREPYTHAQIPNVSFAGYNRGDDPLPRPSGPVFDVSSFGAEPNDGEDASHPVNDAIRAAEAAGGGVVHFPEGRFRFDAPIWVHGSNIVLRGSGSDRTTLYFHQPLEEAYRAARMGEWSWTGGLIWFIPRELKAALEESDWQWGANEGWLNDEPFSLIRTFVPRGSFRLPVAETHRLEAGDHVLLTVNNTIDNSLLAHLCGDLPVTSYDFGEQASSLHRQKNYQQYRWPVLIKEVRKHEVLLAQPTKIDLRPEWSPQLALLGPRVEQSGLEHLTLQMRQAPQREHNNDRGFNGPHFQAAVNCWAKDVHVVDSENGFGFTSAKGVTLSDVRVSGQARHHSFICREQTHDCLVQRFLVPPATTQLANGAKTHGINVEGYSSGNVWSDGVMEGTFDSHRRIPFENVRTQITLTNKGVLGGARRAGPHWGARFAHWNISVSNKRAYAVRLENHAPYSVIVGISGTDNIHPKPPEFAGPIHTVATDLNSAVRPSNLYEAQLTHRHRTQTAFRIEDAP